jgi:DNA invertase Pin-like site-specific DNA recombinase
VTVARYHRVSTDEQNPQRQLDATEDYVARNFDGRDVRVFVDRSTGTDTARSEYQDMMDAVAADEINTVVVHEVSRVSRSIRDLSRTVDTLEDHDAALHIISEGIVMDPDEADPYQRALLQLLGVFAELEANMIQNRVREGIAARKQDEEYHHGPAPLGFNKSDGRLIEAENYDRVVTTLEYVDGGEMSKREAARRLECSRSTIGRALNRSEVYGLPER